MYEMIGYLSEKKSNFMNSLPAQRRPVCIKIMGSMHECFLNQLACSLYQQHRNRISDLTLIFPNRRAGLFFTEYLNRVIDGPVFAPEIVTVQELFAHISPLRQVDPLQLIFRLYKVYRELSGTKESFDEFFLWGEMLLHDFDQVDKYLVDAELLFTNITDLKEIDEHFNDWNEERREEIRHFWKSLASSELKSDQKEFARLWQVLYPVFKRLKEELGIEKIAYEGMLFRDAVTHSEYLQLPYLTDRKFVVAGFNALNACERRLFLSMKERGNVSFFWDFDEYYLKDADQEAGHFMRENLALFPMDDPSFGSTRLVADKSRQIFHTTSQIGQAQIAAKEAVSQISEENSNFDTTAIILCDEELLLPVLSALPDEIEKVNVTMGLPIKLTPLFSLIGHLVMLQRTCKKEGNNDLFHYKSVTEILNNQLIKTLYQSECKLIVENIVQKNLLYVSDKELRSNELFGQLFSTSDKVQELPEYFLSVLYHLFLAWEKTSNLNYAVSYQEYIYQVYLSVNKLNNLLFTEGEAIMGSKDFLSRETFFKLLLQYLSALNVAFEGEPLAGLQVMGILETRSLDFKNVILLSVNEGIMPRANVSGSFIPYHLRRGVGLPTAEEQNAMYAYYFYRLLQRAEKVTFVYNSGSNGLKTGEKSRFLYQLQLESPFYIPERAVENSIDPLPNYPISIEKKGKVVEALGVYTEQGRKLSPTALDQYLHCPLSFYFKYIARLEEAEDVVEEVDARIFGKIFHAVMEHIYLPLVNQTISESMLETILVDEETINEKLLAAFGTHFFRQDVATPPVVTGRNKLVFEVIRKMVIQTIRVDQARTPFVLKGLEQKVDATISINNETKAIRLGGIIDRIDYQSGATEILDYKTGETDLTFTSIADLFDRQAKKRNKAAFQTLVYGYIWNQLYPDSGPIYPGIFALKKIFGQESLRLTVKEDETREVNYLEVKDRFEPMLRGLLEEIFDPAVPFVQTTVDERCSYCPFASICGKESAQS